MPENDFSGWRPYRNSDGDDTRVHETIAMKLAYEMKLAHSVPLDGSPIALGELTEKDGSDGGYYRLVFSSQ